MKEVERLVDLLWNAAMKLTAAQMKALADMLDEKSFELVIVAENVEKNGK